MQAPRWRQAGANALIQALALGASACLLAALGNALAPTRRKLSWRASAPSVAPAALPAATPSPADRPTPLPAPTQALKEAPKAAVVESPRPTSTPSPFAMDPARPLRSLEPPQASAAFKAHLSFLDARRSDEYAEGHIAGAWCLPVWEADIETRITLFEAGARPSGPDPLVIYCNGGDCEDSNLLAERLMRLGYRNLWIYRAGYPDWVQRQLPTAKGTQP